MNTTLLKKVRPNLYVSTDADIQRLMETVEGADMELPILLAAFGPMRREDYGNDDVLKAVYRYAMNNR